MKNSRMHWMLLCAALALPTYALAQHGHAPAAPSAPKSPDAPSAPDAPEWNEQEMDELMVLGGDEDMWFIEGDEAGGAGTWEDESGGQRRIVVRNVHRGPGGKGGGGGMHGGMGMHMRMAKLDLTDAQRDKMRDLHEAAMRKNIQRQADMKLARMDLHKLMRADAPSTQSVNAQIDKMAKLHADGTKSRFETHMQARALLTPEQLKKLKAAPGPGASSGMMMHHGSGGPEGAKH